MVRRRRKNSPSQLKHFLFISPSTFYISPLSNTFLINIFFVISHPSVNSNHDLSLSSSIQNDQVKKSHTYKKPLQVPYWQSIWNRAFSPYTHTHCILIPSRKIFAIYNHFSPLLLVYLTKNCLESPEWILVCQKRSFFRNFRFSFRNCFSPGLKKETLSSNNNKSIYFHFKKIPFSFSPFSKWILEKIKREMKNTTKSSRMKINNNLCT